MMPPSQQDFVQMRQLEQNLVWSERELDLRPYKWQAGVPLKKSNKYLKAAAAITVFIFCAAIWLIYITQFWPLWNVWGMLGVVIAVGALIAVRTEEASKEKTGFRATLSVVQNISFFIIVLIASDLMFDVYLFPTLFQVEDLYTGLAVDLGIILAIVALQSIILLSHASKRVEVSTAVKYIMPSLALIISAISLFWLVRAALTLEIAQLFVEAQQSAGAVAFSATFEALLYNEITGFLLAIMAIGTFANIFVVNQSRVQALQSATTMTTVGIPMIVIVSMFVGLVEPPVDFTDFLGSSAIASFVFTFAMLSVYIIFLSVMLVFTQAAEIFNVGEEE